MWLRRETTAQPKSRQAHFAAVRTKAIDIDSDVIAAESINSRYHTSYWWRTVAYSLSLSLTTGARTITFIVAALTVYRSNVVLQC
jgi:hypothetical protein